MKIEIRRFFQTLVLVVLALACAPFQALLDQAKLRTIPSSSSGVNSRSKAILPTRTSAQMAVNGAPLAHNLTAHENIYAAQGVTASFQRTIITDADLTSRRLMSDLGWSGVERVNVYLFPSRPVWLQGIEQIGGLGQGDVSFQANLPGDAWITIGGTAHSGIYLYPIQQSSAETLHMLAHEYTHVVQQQTLGGQAVVPDWLLEGMAEAEGWRIAASQYPREYSQNEAELQRVVSNAAKEKRLFSLNGISAQQSWQVKLERPWSATLEYAESQMAIEFLQKLKGTNAPMNILIAVTNGADFATAFEHTTGISISTFETKFFASLK